jgi:hypothetical protein
MRGNPYAVAEASTGLAIKVIVKTSGWACLATVMFKPALISRDGGSDISRLSEIGVDVIFGPNDI